MTDAEFIEGFLEFKVKMVKAMLTEFGNVDFNRNVQELWERAQKACMNPYLFIYCSLTRQEADKRASSFLVELKATSKSK